MFKNLVLVFFLGCFVNLQAQVENDTIDYKYLEDQLYFSISYNILTNKPKDDSNSLFSSSLSLGFIKDIPFNKQRNVGMGIGLGYEFNSYRNNILFYADDDDVLNEEYLNEKLKTNMIEMPIEFRWRTSTPTKYNFWRIYGGVKMAYAFYSKSIVELDGEKIVIKNFDLVERFQYGLTLSAGYGTWNIYGYYGLSSIFNSKDVEGEPLEVADFKIGLKFYIM